MLQVFELEKTFTSDFGQVAAIGGVTFTIEDGEFYTLLGPSGCGKTTTLQCVGGLEWPDSGRIVLDGVEVYPGVGGHGVPAHQRDIGMVFQSYAIWPHMTVFDNVSFPLSYGRRKLGASEIRERAMWALGLVQLEHLASRPAPFLSGGQQQRVALARAVVHEPKLLLLDEPLSNLDARLREEMRAEIRMLVQRLGITTLYVTHDQVEALSMSDRVSVMSAGRIVQEGTPRDLYFAPQNQFVAEFLGNSTFLDGRVTGLSPSSARSSDHGIGDVETALGKLQCRLGATVGVGDNVLVAIRSEGAQVVQNGHQAGGNVIRGTLESVLFAGESCEGRVRAGEQIFRVKLDPFDQRTAGEEMSLRLPPERCVAVPRG